MSRRLHSLPKGDGFYMPAEWFPHQQTWMIWPERTDNWRLGAKPAQAAFSQVIESIAGFEPVSVGVSAMQYFNASERLSQLHTKYPIRVVELSSNDAWVRDTGPTFVRHADGRLCGVDWEFNAWGGLGDGLYFPWDKDDQVAHKILSLERLDRYRADGFVLEGGSIHVDGEGTLLTTKECLLNKHRNPHLTLPAIERKLQEYLGIEKVLWLQEGLCEDETNGHIDNMACFVRPGEVVLAWTDDSSDPQYLRSKAALEYLQSAVDARGRRLTVHKLPLPKPLFSQDFECASVDMSNHCKARQPGIRLAASYINFYRCNGGLIVPTFDGPLDQQAANILQDLIPNDCLVTVPGREILLGGGNVHCITQQQPT